MLRELPPASPALVRPARRRAGQRGQVLVLFSLVMGFLGVTLIIGTADVLVLLTAHERADEASALAAQAAAEVVDAQAFARGQRLLLVGQPGDGGKTTTVTAYAFCERTITQVAPGAAPFPPSPCSITTTRVTVDVRINVRLPFPFPGLPTQVSARHLAQPIFGTNVPIP